MYDADAGFGWESKPVLLRLALNDSEWRALAPLLRRSKLCWFRPHTAIPKAHQDFLPLFVLPPSAIPVIEIGQGCR